MYIGLIEVLDWVALAKLMKRKATHICIGLRSSHPFWRRTALWFVIAGDVEDAL